MKDTLSRLIITTGLLSFLLFFSPLLGEGMTKELIEDLFTKGVTVDLRDPEYSEGTLKTTKGGVIKGPNVRVQAQNIIYTRKVVDGSPVFSVEAEGDLMLELGDSVFIGSRLEYNFQTSEGILYDGRTSMEPWFFGGEVIKIRADGSYVIYNGFITTSENSENEWQITSDRSTLVGNSYVTAKNVLFRLVNLPILWVPSLKANLDSIFDAPLHYTFHKGGRQGTRGGVVYELFSWNHFKMSLRLDYRLKRGPGGGIETHYKSEDHKEHLETINYIANDSSVENPHERTRYRFQGVYDNLLFDDRVSVDMTWDKLSDKEMATDYSDNDLELDTAGRTQLLVRTQEDLWITNFVTRVRVNDFQTIKQELPTIETTFRPFEIGSTGIISNNLIKTSYLDFVYSNDQTYVRNYHSGRIEVSPTLYRPIVFKNFTLTPQAGMTAIYYNDSPQGRERWMVIGLFECELNTNIYRFYGDFKHAIQPYAKYSYFTMPAAPPKDIYIFDIDDGWYRLDTLRLGIRNNFYVKQCNNCINRAIMLDLYTNAFFDTPTIRQAIPYVYSNLVFTTFSFLRHTFGTAWNFDQGELNYFNLRTDWTVSQDIALAFEYRHRSSYDWRKVDHNNYILDSYRSTNELRHSQLSDRRDTFLLHAFYRFDPSWACEFEMRSGWNRRHEPNYLEYEVDLLTTLQSASAWNIKLSYQHKEQDRGQDRIAIYFSVGLKRPDRRSCENLVPCLEF